MDKVLGLVALLVVGVPLVVLSFCISWLMDDEEFSSRELHHDGDIRIYIPSKCRRNRGDNRHDNDFKKGEKK